MDYAECVIAVFVDLRAKGATVSAIDQEQLLTWEDEGVPVHAVLDGLHDAFARKSTPPKSIRECKRWVSKRAKAWAEGDTTPPAVAPLAESAPAEAAAPEPAFAVRLDERLGELCEAPAPLGDAARALRDEVVQLRARQGPLSTATRALLDVALAMHIVNALPAPERAAIQARASAAIVAARDAGRTEVAAAQAKQRVLESAARAHSDWGSLSAL